MTYLHQTTQRLLILNNLADSPFNQNIVLTERLSEEISELNFWQNKVKISRKEITTNNRKILNAKAKQWIAKFLAVIIKLLSWVESKVSYAINNWGIQSINKLITNLNDEHNTPTTKI